MAGLEFIRQRRQKLAELPWPLIAMAGLILCLGLAFIYSATNDFAGGHLASQTGENNAEKQIVFACVGGLGLLLVATSDYRKLAPFYLAAFLAGMGMLVACAVIGVKINGARSWIKLPLFNIQVAELCKLCYIVTLAGFLRYRKNVESFRMLLVPLVITAAMLGPILLQPDFGTAMIFVPIFFAIIWCSGARARFLIPLLIAGALLLPGAYLGGMFKPHQKARIDTFLASLTGGTMDRSGDGYHITMSMNAIGSSGPFGRGYGEGALSQADYLPERHTDFIFSVFAEETGFVGTLGLFVLYFSFLVLCLLVASRTREPFGRLLVVGVATMFFAQFAINIGMTCGVMPVTGLPLPFVSYGGSSLVTSMLALGIVISVHLHPTRMLGRD